MRKAQSIQEFTEVLLVTLMSSPQNLMKPDGRTVMLSGTTHKMVLVQAAVLSADNRYFSRDQLGASLMIQSDVAISSIYRWQEGGYCTVDRLVLSALKTARNVFRYNVRLNAEKLRGLPRLELPRRYEDECLDPLGYATGPLLPEVLEARAKLLKAQWLDLKLLKQKTREGYQERLKAIDAIRTHLPDCRVEPVWAALGVPTSLLWRAVHRRPGRKALAQAGGAA
ncbi:hypothetical protein [Tolypothrix sp. VBCCA 56010]|uniref:hypothetical protein n=1 Tax=Tolypothrix sp. VBCCA 56010 TaxID=3137731 RepID=UPI003D7DCE8F